MNKNEIEKDLRTATRSYYSCLKGTVVQITRLEKYITRFAIWILALTLLLVLIKG